MIKPLNGVEPIIIKKEVIKGCEQRDGRVFNYTPELHHEVLENVQKSETGVAKIDARLFFEKMGDPVGFEAEKSFRKFVRYFNGKHFPMSVDYDDDNKRFRFKGEIIYTM